VGIEDKFIRDLSEQMRPNSSAIFLLVRSVSPEHVIPQIAVYGGKVLETSLDPELAAQLQAVLDQSKHVQG
jgi:uncharacterized membrane protein